MSWRGILEMLGRVCWGDNIGLRETVNLRDRPDSGGSAQYGWSMYLESWIGIYTESNGLYMVGRGGILGTKNLPSKSFGSKTVYLSELVDFFYRSILLV